MLSFPSEATPALSALVTVVNVAATVFIVMMVAGRNRRYRWLYVPLALWMIMLAFDVPNAIAAIVLHQPDDILPVVRTLWFSALQIGIALYLGLSRRQSSGRVGS